MLCYCCNPSFGFATKVKGLQGCGPRESSGVTSHTLRSVGKCEGVNPHTPKATPTLGDGVSVNSQNFIKWFQGSNSMACSVLYIIGKLLERRCLKWALIAHLDIWNTSCGQKKGRESNCQFDSRPEKVGNQPDLLAYRRYATYCWKALDEGYNFVEIASRSELCSQSYGAPKLWESQLWEFRDSHLGVPGQKVIWMWAPWRGAKYTIRGKVVASPKSGPWLVLCVRVARGKS